MSPSHKSPDQFGVFRVPWDARVEKILASVNREARILMWLGFIVYGSGSAIIISMLWKQPAIATLVVMYFFQLLVIFMSVRKIYPKISSSVALMLESNKDAVPAFEELGDLVREARQAVQTGEHPVLKRLEGHLIEISTSMKAIQARVERDTTPLPGIPRRRPAEPVVADGKEA